MTIKEIQKFHNAPRELAKKELRQQARQKMLSEKTKIKILLVKYGDTDEIANDKMKYYEIAKKCYKNAKPAKLAQVMTVLWAND